MNYEMKQVFEVPAIEIIMFKKAERITTSIIDPDQGEWDDL